jgi:SAM-dependent methyltransferase
MKQTTELEYTKRLIRLQEPLWKKILDVQAPYRWNLRRLKPGFVLEIGCGLGRNLKHLQGAGVGVDHNPHSVEYARGLGLLAFTVEEFEKSEFNTAGRFDSLLLSHVAEHMSLVSLTELLRARAPLVRSGGKLILVCPQEAGFTSDASHVEFMNFDKLRDAAKNAGFVPQLEYSFPFPRIFGRIFLYNEFVSVSRKP